MKEKTRHFVQNLS